MLEAITGSDVAIARGAGLSNAAASFGGGALSIDMTRFDRILAYDAQSGVVELEPGVRVGELAKFLASKGRHLPALPGYPSITVGGCIAFDVHGKGQLHAGNFGDWTESVQLHHRDHGALFCSREREAEPFALTLGGAGLTGIICSARLRTAPLPGASVERQTVSVRNLLEAADLLLARGADAASSYSWNDLNRRTDRFGAGVVYLERFVDGEVKQREPRAKLEIRSTLPLRLWNRASTRVALSVHERLQRNAQPKVLPLHAALFPIHGKEHYYAAFGKHGFREYQLVVPFACWPSFVAALDQLLGRSAVPVTLGSLKLFRGQSRFLRFRADGICLALDVPASDRASALFERLDELALNSGAIVNLAKDSRLSARTCERLFPEYAAFREGLARFDPKRRCRSRLRTLLNL